MESLIDEELDHRIGTLGIFRIGDKTAQISWISKLCSVAIPYREAEQIREIEESPEQHDFGRRRSIALDAGVCGVQDKTAQPFGSKPKMVARREASIKGRRRVNSLSMAVLRPSKCTERWALTSRCARK